MAEDDKYDKMKEADVVVRYIKSRFVRGKGTNIFIIGLSGTGKSSASQRIGELVIEARPKENLKMFIVDSLLKLIEAVKQTKLGDIIVIEEVSVLFPSRRAMGGENVAVGKIFDTIRKKKVCLISNCPLWHSVDKHMRSMGDIMIQTLNINRRKGVVISKFFRLQTHPATSKTYTHTMTRDGFDVALMITRMPNLVRWNEYEADKDKFIEEMYEELKQKQLKKEGKQTPQPKIKDLTTQEFEVRIDYFIKKLTQEEIANKKGISQPRVAQIIKNIIKKGGFAKEPNIIR